jgi:alkylation response protein AidB-like acyl-CoA dehydrogenase
MASPGHQRLVAALTAVGTVLTPTTAPSSEELRWVSGTDPTQIESTGVLEGDEWVLNGRKWMITNASIADFIIFMASPLGWRRRATEQIGVIPDQMVFRNFVRLPVNLDLP